MAMLLITHDMGVVARMADRVAVMYAGQIVEQGSVRQIFSSPAHPYTVGLRAALPEGKSREQGLQGIPGSPPDLIAPPPGCGFFARCPHAMQICGLQPVPEFSVDNGVDADAAHGSRCWLRHPQLLEESL